VERERGKEGVKEKESRLQQYETLKELLEEDAHLLEVQNNWLESKTLEYFDNIFTEGVSQRGLEDLDKDNKITRKRDIMAAKISEGFAAEKKRQQERSEKDKKELEELRSAILADRQKKAEARKIYDEWWSRFEASLVDEQKAYERIAWSQYDSKELFDFVRRTNPAEFEVALRNWIKTSRPKYNPKTMGDDAPTKKEDKIIEEMIKKYVAINSKK
jgi:hypothetical protein